MQATIVAMDATENIPFRKMFLKPWRMVYPKELILKIFTSLFIVCHNTALHGNNTLLKLIHKLPVMGNHKNRGTPLIYIRKQLHDLIGI